MELKLIDGVVRWAKKDGTASKKAVSVSNTLSFLGFPCFAGSSDSVKILLGDPYKNNKLIIRVSGPAYVDFYLIDSQTKNSFHLAYNADNLIEQGILNLDNAQYHPYKSFREIKIEDSIELKPESLKDKRGLDIVEDDDLFWIKGEKKFVRDIPYGWGFLLKGDALLTKEVKKGPHWNLHKLARNTYYNKPGIFAPENNIKNAFKKLGAEEGQEARLNKKREIQQKREQKYDQQFLESIKSIFPNIPENDLHQIVANARSGGHVGCASFIYFAKKEDREEDFATAAKLAVRAHVRHNYTEYHELMLKGCDRQEARHLIQDDICNKLSEWR